MKNLLTAKQLSLLMLLSLLGGKAEANRYHEDDGYVVNDNRGGCCESSCYECACNPLYCGAWDLQVHGGVAPVIWRHRGPVVAVDLNAVTPFPLVNLTDSFPRFTTFFKTPWTVGGQVGYAWSDNTRVYLEFNYVQARAKSNVLVTSLVTPVNFTAPLPLLFNLNKYKLFDGYVGARYYFDRWCDRVSFFLGGKVGFTHHKSINTTLSFATTAPATPGIASTPLFTKNTNISGGANFGLDICFCGNWSVVITGEVVASCGPENVGNINVPAGTPGIPVSYSVLLFGHIGTELRFPVTAGIRYSF